MGIERYALFADESGNSEEPLRVLAGLSGPLKGLLKLERNLRLVLAQQGLDEVKWANVRTRPKRLRAAHDFLALAAKALAAGELALDLLVWERLKASKAWDKLGREEQWLALYLGLVKRVRSRWKGASLNQLALYPDQRSGMRWSTLKRRSGVRRVTESSSRRLALIQLADLLAGLARFIRQPHEPSLKGVKARQKRWELAVEFEALCSKNRRKVGLWMVSNIVGGRDGRKKERH